jgi:carbamoylphosphate synthase small subunit
MDNNRIYYAGSHTELIKNMPEVEQKKHIDKPVKSPNKKLTLVCIVQNESKNLPRFIDNVIKDPSIGRVVAIDGGSKDNTVKLLKKAGAEVYIHAYDKNYHDAQAMQRNISFSYVENGERCIVMDIDECFSKELSDYY